MPLFTRSSHNPIIKPNKNHDWESLKVYNPGAIYSDGQYHLFYRAVGKSDNWHSSIGLAVSSDGEHFKRLSGPIIKPSGLTEKRGVEDPRMVKIDNTFYLAYTAFDGKTARLCLATSLDLETWEKHGEMLDDWNAEKGGAFQVLWDPAQQNPVAKKHWSKAGGIFPELIGNETKSFGAVLDNPRHSLFKTKDKYWMIFGSRNLWLATSEDGIKWQANLKPWLRPRTEDYFDSVHLEMGPPPVKTPKGWLILYHGVDSTITYRLGFIITDLKNPNKILYRSKKPIFIPRANYEMAGIVDILPGGLGVLEKMNAKELNNHINNLQNKHKLPHVVFCCGAVLKNDILRIYYGASDTFICTATAKLNYILKLVE